MMKPKEQLIYISEMIEFNIISLHVIYITLFYLFFFHSRKHIALLHEANIKS